MMDIGSRKRFVGETMNEAVGAMRDSLGRDALLVSSNKIRQGGIFGLGGRELFEVVGEERPYQRDAGRSSAERPSASRPGTERSSAERTRGRRTARREAQAPTTNEAVEQILAAADKERGRRRPVRWESAETIQLELPFEGEESYSRSDAGLYGRTGAGRKSRQGRGMTRGSGTRASDTRVSGNRAASTRAFDLDRHPLSDPQSRRQVERDSFDTRVFDTLRDEIAALKDEFRSVLLERRSSPAVPSSDVLPGVGVTSEEEIPAPPSSGPIVAGLLARMLSSGVPQDLANRIMESVIARSAEADFGDAAIMKARFRKEAAALIEIAAPLEPSPDRPLIIFAIGPTGVGKTTTLAKLGAIFSEEESRQIAFVTIDHYRIAAQEQLRTYSEILGVPFETATAPGELRDVIGRHMDKDVIFVDTAGRSPFSAEGIEEIRQMREGIGIESQALLFVSSTTSLEQMENVISRFRPADSARLVFTKVDETSQWGPLFAAAVRSALPVAYSTNGQSVPFDIEPARAVRFAEAILGETAGR